MLKNWNKKEGKVLESTISSILWRFNRDKKVIIRTDIHGPRGGNVYKINKL